MIVAAVRILPFRAHHFKELSCLEQWADNTRIRVYWQLYLQKFYSVRFALRHTNLLVYASSVRSVYSCSCTVDLRSDDHTDDLFSLCLSNDGNRFVRVADRTRVRDDINSFSDICLAFSWLQPCLKRNTPLVSNVK